MPSGSSRPFRFCLAGLALALAACGRHEPRSAPGTPARWALTRITTINPAADSFYDNIQSVAADRDGNIYVAGEGGGGIRVYDSAGALLRVLGREGSGPGEFRHKYSLAWAGDTLAVYDPGNGRVEFIDREGHWVASHPNARISGGQIRFHQAGPNSFFTPSFRFTPDRSGIVRLYIREGFGQPADTLQVPESHITDPYVLTCRSPAVISDWAPDDAPRAGDAVSPAGALVTWRSDQYRVSFLDKAAGVTRVLADSALPVPISDSAWAVQLANFREWHDRFKGLTCDRAEPVRPPAGTLLRTVEFDDAGRAWIEGMRGGRWSLAVYDTAGHFTATMPAPVRDPDVPYVIRGNRLYTVAADSGGAQTVVVYRIRAGEAGR